MIFVKSFSRRSRESRPRPPWWVVEGVKEPTYIGIEGRSLRAEIVALVIGALIFALIQLLSDMLTRRLGLASIIALLVGLSATIVLELYRKPKKQSHLEEFYRNVLKSFGSMIEKWCIPSPVIPINCLLRNNMYLIVTLMYGFEPHIILIKPVVYTRVTGGKPVVKLKWVRAQASRSIGRNYVKVKSGLAIVTFPHIDFRNMLYTTKAYAIDLLVKNPDKLSAEAVSSILSEIRSIVDAGLY